MVTAQAPVTAPVPYPASLNIDYPDRKLNRLTSFLRFFMIIPILIILALLVNGLGGGGNMPWVGNTPGWEMPVMGGDHEWGGPMDRWGSGAMMGGVILLPLVLMILFRQKYPKWWFDWNLALSKFSVRVSAYLMLLRDEYPSTDEEQASHVDLTYPEVKTQLNRWMPLIKWFLAIPHWFVLCFLGIAAFVCVFFAWFAILFTGRYPKGLFDFVVGVMRWSFRVKAYALLMVTDKYPPFSLEG